MKKNRVQFVNYRVSAVGIIDKPTLKEEPLDPKASVPKPMEQRKVLFQEHRDFIDTSVYLRDELLPGCRFTGPAIIEQMDTTIVIPPLWNVQVDTFYNLKLTFDGGEDK